MRCWIHRNICCHCSKVGNTRGLQTRSSDHFCIIFFEGTTSGFWMLLPCLGSWFARSWVWDRYSESSEGVAVTLLPMPVINVWYILLQIKTESWSVGGPCAFLLGGYVKLVTRIYKICHRQSQQCSREEDYTCRQLHETVNLNMSTPKNPGTLVKPNGDPPLLLVSEDL